MLIKRIEIQNFRSLQSIDLDCGASDGEDSRALVALLGRNGGGKSSILYALDVFYDTNAKVSVEDCYARDSSREIVIRVTYGRLRDQERKEFAPYIDNDQLIVTKRISVGEKECVQKYFAAARQIPEFANIRNINQKKARIDAYKRLVDSGQFEGLPNKPRSADEVDHALSEYERNHPELLQICEREAQFFGPKDVGGGKLDKFTKFVLVPAVRLAAGEAQKKGAIHELINLIVLRQVNNREDVKKLRAEIEEKVATVFNQDNLTELSTLGESISKLLQQYAPGASLRLRWSDAVVPPIPLPDPKAELVEDDYPCPITHAGHGLQRALVLTLLQQLAVTQVSIEESEPPAEDRTGSGNGEAVTATPSITSPDLILAIEEPELYLHPSRCRYLSDILLQLSRVPARSSDPCNQIIYATHSPYFVDLDRFDEVRIVRKLKQGDDPAPCCNISQYSLADAAKELARVSEGDPRTYTSCTFRSRTLPIMTLAVNEGFFANAVVVVEGLSDLGILWGLQEVMSRNWAALGIAVVPAMGKENLDRPVVVFRGLQIPTYFLFDADGSHRGTGSEASTIRRNRRYQRLAGLEEPEDFPATRVADIWAVFEENIEEVIRDAISDDYDSLSDEIANALGYEQPSKVMKNTEGAAEMIRRIYARGRSVPVLEEVVKKVTNLLQPTLSSIPASAGD